MKAYDTSFLLHAKNCTKNPKVGQNGFCRDEIYVEIFTKCVISLEILDGFQQIKY